MDAEVLQHVEFLRNNVSALRSLGKEWGMKEEEINSCIDEVIANSTDKEKLEPTLTSTGRQIWSLIRFSFKFWLVILFLISITCTSLYFVTSYNSDVESFISRTLQPFGYDIFRYVRLITLPLHDMFNITEFYDAECIVENPYFTEPEISCVYCEGTTSLITFQTINASLVTLLLEVRQPLLHQGGSSFKVTYSDLRDTYLHNKNVFDGEPHHVESTQDSVQSLHDLFDSNTENIINTESFVVKWYSKGVQSSNLLRKLFPRPAIIPVNTEIAVEKVLYLDGPSSHHYQLPRGKFPLALYIQASGKRKAVLQPRDNCQTFCQIFNLNLNERDILLFDQALWHLILLPAIDGTAVGFSSTFTE
ncbi:uncharacterized protein LOC132554763 [Ylistrum balloti]|uniref:uncharacterized protein LOC132554763 n=1 Tax=Ylistrum balloti TaxID=509963 RepID=UPI002905DBB8|nr:uncharacterized protein LOC132554763 [Ylistrum balloti]